MYFSDLTLPDQVRQGIDDAGFNSCTPIQEQTLPIALTGKDVAGQAQTGTGKTAAFLIALFTRLLGRERSGDKRHPRALILAPTRELVVQIEKDAQVLGAHCGFTIQAIYGGVDYMLQKNALKEGADVVVGDVQLQGGVRAERLRMAAMPDLEAPLLGMDVLSRLRFTQQAGVLRIEPAR